MREYDREYKREYEGRDDVFTVEEIRNNFTGDYKSDKTNTLNSFGSQYDEKYNRGK